MIKAKFNRQRPMMNTDASKQFIDRFWDKTVIPSLKDYVAIPCKSPAFDAGWRKAGHLHDAVNHCKQWCESLGISGLSAEIHELKHRTPLLFIEIPGVDDDQSVLVYGHLDKQPEAEGWDADKGPWKPVIEDEKLYGRGAADDGYALYSAISSVAALRDQGVSHPAIKLFIECSEESGSPDIKAYLDHLKDRIGTPDLVLVLDSGCGNYDQMWVTTSLRGLIGGDLTVRILNEAVHSGDASGIVPSSFRIIRKILSRIEDPENGEIKPDFLHDKIPNNRMQEAKQVVEVLGDQIYSKFPFVEGASPLSKNLTSLVLNRTWRPTLCITGADGIPLTQSAGNALRPMTTLKLSLRLPPTLPAKSANKSLKSLVEDNPPYGAQVVYDIQKGGRGWNAPAFSNWLENSIKNASEEFYGLPPVYMGEGGSIPLIAMLGRRFKRAQFIVTGVLGPHSNAHGPNEFLHLPMVKRLSGCIATILSDQGQRTK